MSSLISQKSKSGILAAEFTTEPKVGEYRRRCPIPPAITNEEKDEKKSQQTIANTIIFIFPSNKSKGENIPGTLKNQTNSINGVLDAPMQDFIKNHTANKGDNKTHNIQLYALSIHIITRIKKLVFCFI